MRAGQKRLALEYKSLKSKPPEYIQAYPSENDIYTWYYILSGPPDTPYSGGQYYGMLRFPVSYPNYPPEIQMLTPNGRLATGTPLCLSISSFHPEEWNPSWTISAILVGVLSYMCGDEIGTGVIQTPEELKLQLAAQSRDWNKANIERK